MGFEGQKRLFMQESCQEALNRSGMTSISSETYVDLIKEVPNKFFSIKMKESHYLGQRAISLYINHVTPKIRSKLKKLSNIEKK